MAGEPDSLMPSSDEGQNGQDRRPDGAPRRTPTMSLKLPRQEAMITAGSEIASAVIRAAVCVPRFERSD
jgi:hypothetical protein